MSSVPIWKQILYELQPFRVEDVIIMLQVMYDILQAFEQLSVHLYTNYVYEVIVANKTLPLIFWVKFAIWILGLGISIIAEFSSVYAIATGFYLLFQNLGQKKDGDISAYSVFNTGFKRLMGTYTAEQFDDWLRNRPREGADNEGLIQGVVDEEPLAPPVPVQNGNIIPPNPAVRRRGKKARRTYEARVKRRENEQQAQQEIWNDWEQEGMLEEFENAQLNEVLG